MKQIITGPAVPTAQICINKSRLKIYNKEKDPTYYLEHGQEFQIELYNPTSDTVLAKIELNGKAIAQGGLVLRPAERVFLERYMDVAKKFLFETYEVANTAQNMKAIESNGDIKVEFYNESTPYYYNPPVYYPPIIYTTPTYYDHNYYKSPSFYFNNTGSAGLGTVTTTNSNGDNLNLTKSLNTTLRSSSNEITLDACNNLNASYCSSSETYFGDSLQEIASLGKPKKSKTIETGRVEQGSYSAQKFTTVNKSFDYFAFHTVEYKLLPISQKINTTADISVKQYCTQCGRKVGKTDNFCSGCGKKA